MALTLLFLLVALTSKYAPYAVKSGAVVDNKILPPPRQQTPLVAPEVNSSCIDHHNGIISVQPLYDSNDASKLKAIKHKWELSA